MCIALQVLCSWIDFKRVVAYDRHLELFTDMHGVLLFETRRLNNNKLSGEIPRSLTNVSLQVL